MSEDWKWQLTDDVKEMMRKWDVQQAAAQRDAEEAAKRTAETRDIKSIKILPIPEMGGFYADTESFALRLAARNPYRFAKEFPDFVEIEYYEGPGAPDMYDNTVHAGDKVIFASIDCLYEGEVVLVQGEVVYVHHNVHDRDYGRHCKQVMKLTSR